jgi:hypothetical protein
MTKDEALKLALDALELPSMKTYAMLEQSGAAITAIKEALAQPAPPPECKTEAEQTEYAFGWWKALETVRTEQPAQEPVAWMMKWAQHSPSFTTDKSDYVSWFAGKASYPDELVPLYTAPQQRPWVGLTDEEINLIYAAPQTHIGQYARAIEDKLKEKNFD